MRASALGLLVLLGCSSAPAPVHSTSAPHAAPRVPDANATAISITDPVGDEGKLLVLQGAVFRPLGPKPASGYPVVVFNHGSPLDAAERPKMTPNGYATAVQWFTDRGYVVVAALRRGFGTSGGKFTEGVSCDAPDYAKAGRTAAHDIRAIFEYVKRMPDVDLDRLVIAGHSAGGFGSIALLGEDGVKARAAISFAGGKGAGCLHLGPPYTDDIVAAAGVYGKKARTPSLWIYADNDSLFAPPLPDRMFAAYREGGAPAELVHIPATGKDGHALFTKAAEAEWTAAADRFLSAQGLPSRAP